MCGKNAGLWYPCTQSLLSEIHSSYLIWKAGGGDAKRRGEMLRWMEEAGGVYGYANAFIAVFIL